MAIVQPGIAPLEQLSNAATASPGCGANSRRRASSRIVRCVKTSRDLSTNAFASATGRDMSESIKLPDQCVTMEDVRAGVDATDRELMELLDRRFGYMRAAARIKPTREAVRDEARKAKVVSAAGTDAETRGLPRADIEKLWDRLVETSISYEFEIWDATRS